MNIINQAEAILLGGLLGIWAQSGWAATAASPRAQLKTAVEQLQRTPEDAKLREKIIALAKKVKPAVPEEARRHYVMAVTLQKKAKSPEAAAASIAEYEKALLIAPWWADAYYNLSLVDEAAERFDDAAAALKLFLATHPKTAEARQARDRLYALDAQKQLKAVESVKADEDRRKQENAVKDRFIASIVGRWTRSGQGENEGTIDVARAGDGVEVSCRWWGTAVGWTQMTGQEVAVTATSVRFYCEDPRTGIRDYYDASFDGQGRFMVTGRSTVRGEPQHYATGALVQPETIEYVR